MTDDQKPAPIAPPAAELDALAAALARLPFTAFRQHGLHMSPDLPCGPWRPYIVAKGENAKAAIEALAALFNAAPGLIAAARRLGEIEAAQATASPAKSPAGAADWRANHLQDWRIRD